MTNDLIRRDHSAIILWLAACAVLVAMMVMIGGYTRLSGSGLSITVWKPIHGIIPPLTDSAWREEFVAYQQSPQYLKINKGMSLDEFKTIFWPEYIHRLIGRITGAAFFIPLVIFAVRESFSVRFSLRLLGIFGLGALQGVIGWLMVKSGLVNDPQVSALRLALHLSVAFALLAMLIWAVMDLRDAAPLDLPASCKKDYKIWFFALCLQIIFGALMAGTHAGLVYNTWPDINGQFLPDGLLKQPWYENLTLIQLTHRNLAVLVAGGFLFWWYYYRHYVKDNHLGKVCGWVALLIALQFALGVLTLLHQAPLTLAWMHQTVALLLFIIAVILMHKLCHRDTGQNNTRFRSFEWLDPKIR